MCCVGGLSDWMVEGGDEEQKGDDKQCFESCEVCAKNVSW